MYEKLREMSRALLDQTWIDAKTQPKNPHEYCLRQEWSARLSFDDVIGYIRENGYEGVFNGLRYTYFYSDGYEYWTMGSPISDTILINRARKKNLDVEIEGPYGWPKYEGSLPRLPAVRGVYLMTFEYRDGFLPYWVGITRRPMRERFAEHRRKYVDGDYNVLDVAEASQGIRDVAWKGWKWTPEIRADFMERRSEIISQVHQQFSATRIFTMNIGTSPRLLERMEAAIAKYFDEKGDSLFDKGMFLSPRLKTEDPIVANMQRSHILYELPESLVI